MTLVSAPPHTSSAKESARRDRSFRGLPAPLRLYLATLVALGVLGLELVDEHDGHELQLLEHG